MPENEVQYANGCVDVMQTNEMHRVNTEDACSMPAAAVVDQASPTSPTGAGSADLLGMGFAGLVTLGVAIQSVFMGSGCL